MPPGSIHLPPCRRPPAMRCRRCRRGDGRRDRACGREQAPSEPGCPDKSEDPGHHENWHEDRQPAPGPALGLLDLRLGGLYGEERVAARTAEAAARVVLG